MSRTRVFVSSTFFDLAQVRDDIRTTIVDLGHEPVLNEFPSFPVDPNIDTIENCKKAVRSTDFFILIVGGRRGSLDSLTGKSITNIEYETAVQSGIDCFVFVNEQIMTLLPVWKKNPSADFATYVDSPQVFEFIAKIQSAQRWVFTFKKASDISEILKTQLSVFLKDLLVRKRGGRLDPIPEFGSESPLARQLAMDRPPQWEYRLLEELLRSKLSECRRQYSDFERELLFKPKELLDAQEFFERIRLKFDEAVQIVNIIKVSMEQDAMAACGKLGEAGESREILRAVNKMADACRFLLEWELEVASWSVPTRLKSLKDSWRGLSLSILEELERLPKEIAKALEGSWTGTRYVTINLTFLSPPQLQRFKAELAKMQQNSE